MSSSLRLPDRAVHVFFLHELAKEKVPGKASGCLGDLKTLQVVKEYVQPATSKFKTNFIDCLVGGQLGKYEPDGGTLSQLPGTPRAVGPTSYFVSHAWSYTFSGLVSLVERHYEGLADTERGKKFVPVYYWVDILAVTQHFAGDFKDHPDSDFPGVIRASKAVLFTMYPWRSPIAPTRVWCLFEAFTALDVLLDTGGSKDTSVGTVLTVASSVDVRAAQASVPSDNAYIMGCIRDGVGVEAFNAILRKRLKAGAGRDEDDTLDVPLWIPYGSADHVVNLLDGLSGSAVPRRLLLAGREAGQDYTVKLTMGKHGKLDAPVFTYMPLPGKVLAAVARLLQRLQGAGGGAAEERELKSANEPGWTPERSRAGLEKLLGPNFTMTDVRQYIDDHQNRWRKKQLAKLQAAAEAQAAKERPAKEAAERADRAMLWPSLGSCSSLAVLGLYNGWMTADDVEGLGRALRSSRTVQELHLVAVRPEDGYPGGLAGLTRELLAAALGSRSLEVLVLAPPQVAFLEGLEVPAAAAWDLGGGAAIKDFTLAPV
ncbi:hypothetical protein GPECTOR_227g502 [Gonium pectorale]|uniref:Uncharacterized protein n=1 Tax=Gonium pectorale TaxID=33097 RepID=A0A150FXT6_GONPE|nr:hypothetical protein GPECTOR_227g502 [Gonium pectorale]|eukprot:KXZ41995.1 hypothetical protein GPECTOR_227g502 [Gonium pectorale]